MTNEKTTETKETAKKKPSAAKIVKRVCYSVLLVICAILLIMALWLAVDKFILKSPVPSFCGFSMLRVTTGSMEGTIEIGDIILIQKTNDYEVDDIITFMPKGATIPTTHRIIGIAEDGGYITKGDLATNAVDTEPVYDDMICGEVVKIMPILGMFVGWITEGGGYIYPLAIVLILAIGAYLLVNERKMAVLKAQAEAAAAAAKTNEEPAPVAEPTPEATETETKTDGE